MIVRLPSPDIRSLAPSDHRIRPAPLVPVENQGSYTHPTVAEVASPFLSSLSDAKSKLQPTSKIARKCTAFLRLQPLNSPTRFSEDPIKLMFSGQALRRPSPQNCATSGR